MKLRGMDRRGHLPPERCPTSRVMFAPIRPAFLLLLQEFSSFFLSLHLSARPSATTGLPSLSSASSQAVLPCLCWNRCLNRWMAEGAGEHRTLVLPPFHPIPASHLRAPGLLRCAEALMNACLAPRMERVPNACC